MQLTPQQQRAVDRRDGPLFVYAGAGSGKTSVLVERFVRTAHDDGAGVEGVLAITFTEKAAAEMKLRIRERFAELGRRELARETERAWVSTIHGFCSRLLRAHPLAAGIDPEYHVLDEGEAARLALQASERAMEDFLGDHADAERLELIAAYGPDRLGALVREFHARRRSRGEREPRLPVLEDADEREAATCRLLGEVVELFGARYAALKRARSGLDFDDLEVLARDLLRDNPGLRERYRTRFKQVLVDELQDVNPLQNELIQLISGGEDQSCPHGNLFTVGDELQAIYGFRHADVGVFRARRDAAEAAGRIESLTTNFRSRGRILDVVNRAFSDQFGESFQPLVAAEADVASDEPLVDLLVVDRSPARWKEALGEEPFGPGAGDSREWRAAEARLLAKRIEEIVAEDGRSYGDVVILMRAGSDAPLYERALADRGIPTYMAGGGGYWDQQQVADVRAYLAALANPLDELALYAALSSPLGGVSLDAIVEIGLHARRSGRGVWGVLREVSEELRDVLSDRDAKRVSAFVERLERERAVMTRSALEDMVDRAVTESGYDRTVLAMPDGQRRMANLRKLMRVARAYEADEGRDLRGFIDHLDEQRLIRPREGEAPLEGAGLGAVSLMTIHMAKGLEFPVVCVADLGRDGREDDALLDIADDGRIALRIAELDGGYVDSRDHAEIREERKLAGDAEERRIMYVAFTRAQERLVLSGATDLDRWPVDKPLAMPMNWIWRALVPDLGERVARGEVTGRGEGVRWTVCAPVTVDQVLPAADRSPVRALPTTEAQGMLALPPHFDDVPAPPRLPVSRLSYSALASYARCGYRFHLERVAGLHATEEPVPGADETGDISALARGTVVHELLEELDMRAPVIPDDDAIGVVIKAHGGSALPETLADVRGLVRAFVASELRTRLAAATQVRAEVPFAFNLSGERSLLITGYLDVLATEADGTLVVDYKSDALEGREPAELAEARYASQRAIYALAALRAGAERAEVVYCFLERPDEVVSALFTAADAPALERRLAAQAEGLLAGRFEPTDEPGRDLCATCPGRAALCSWPEERTLA